MDGFWLSLLLMTAAAFLLWAGYQLGRDTERDELHHQRDALDAEWTALEQTRQVNDVFFRAREAIRRAEADTADDHR